MSSLFIFVSVAVPLLVYLITPRLIRAKGYNWLLIAACIIMAVSWYLPSPLIDGQRTQFMTHLIGGGVFSGLLWLYCKLNTGWRSHWIVEGASLYALVSALGVMNELFELLIYKLGSMPNGIADTSWDLFANSLGALLVFLAYLVLSRLNKKPDNANRRA